MQLNHTVAVLVLLACAAGGAGCWLPHKSLKKRLAGRARKRRKEVREKASACLMLLLSRLGGGPRITAALNID